MIVLSKCGLTTTKVSVMRCSQVCSDTSVLEIMLIVKWNRSMKLTTPCILFPKQDTAAAYSLTTSSQQICVALFNLLHFALCSQSTIWDWRAARKRTVSEQWCFRLHFCVSGSSWTSDRNFLEKNQQIYTCVCKHSLLLTPNKFLSVWDFDILPLDSWDPIDNLP